MGKRTFRCIARWVPGLLLLLIMTETGLGESAVPLSTLLNRPELVQLSRTTAERYSLFTTVDSLETAKIELDVIRREYSLTIITRQNNKYKRREIGFSKGLLPAFSRHAANIERDPAGTPDSVWCETELMDGSNLVGRFLRWNGLTIECDTELGVLTIPIDRIADFDFIAVETNVAGEITARRDPNPTRLLFAPTARSVKKGEGYFSVYEVVMPSVQYGVGSNISLGGGLSPMMSSEFAMFWLTPKVGIIEKEEWALAAGILSINILASNESGGMGIGYGVATYGKPDKALTLGLGWGYSTLGSDSLDNSSFSTDPFFMIGGEYRMGKSTKLITENWWTPGWSGPMFSVGIRWFAKRISADFALARMSEMEVFAFPWIDFIVNF